MGHIFQINASDGGVPKLPQRQAEVTATGLTTDRQNNTEIHGGPERALCLYSLERITALQEEGHPIFAGSIGENITVSGLAWADVEPGTTLRLGDHVLIEITGYTSPCKNIRESFRASEYGRVSQSRHPGWSRVYARVLEPGSIQVGDRVSFE